MGVPIPQRLIARSLAKAFCKQLLDGRWLRLRLFLTMALVVATLPVTCRAQDDQAPDVMRPSRNLSIEGTVYISGTHAVLERVRVEVLAFAGESLGVKFTDSVGRFEFKNLRPGTYSLTLSLPGFQSAAENIDLNSGSNRDMEFFLKRSTRGTQVPGSPTISAHELSMPVSARDAMTDGIERLNAKKDPLGSIADFTRAIAIAPNYYEAFYQRGMAQWQLGKTPEAEQDLRKSVELSGENFTPAALALGGLLLDSKRATEAEKPLRQAAEHEPSNWLMQYEMGRALLYQGRFDEAVGFADRARQLKSDSPLVYRLLLNIHARQKNQTALLEDLNNYIRLDPDSPAGLRAKKLKEGVERSLAQGQAATGSQPSPKP